jgi:plasmid replication initiation protein
MKTLSPIKEQFIIQSNQLIEAHYRLTLQEKRLLLWLIKEIKTDDKDFRKYKLKITDFAEMMGLNPKTQYKEMKKTTRSLISRPIEFETNKEQSTVQMSWLCFVRWEPKRGFCFLEFHPALKPHLVQLKTHFTKIGFADFLGLKSVYSIRIFELLSQYTLIGKRVMKVEDIRAWCGIREDEYNLYAHLKLRVIQKAKTEINSKTEYEIDYTEIKESRKVVAIEWTIQKKRQPQKLASPQKEYRSDPALLEPLIEYGFTKGIAKRILKNNEEEAIKNALRAVDIQIERNHVKNPKAMLQAAIKERWHPEKFKQRQKIA